MKQSLAWIEKFIDPEKQLEVARLSPEKRFEILCRLIEIGQIELEAYNTWASQLFLLPTLDAQFFLKIDIEPVWQKFQKLKIWNPGLLPVSVWESRLMVACVYPPEDPRLEFSEAPILVLASPLDLRKTWAKLHPKQSKVSENLTPEKTQAPTSAQPPPPQSQPFTENTNTRFELKMDSNFKPIEFGASGDEVVTSTKSRIAAVDDKAGAEVPSGFEVNFDFNKGGTEPKFNFAPPKVETPIQKDNHDEPPIEISESDIKIDIAAPQSPALHATEHALPPPPPPPVRATPVPLPKEPIKQKTIEEKKPSVAPLAPQMKNKEPSLKVIQQPAPPIQQAKPVGPPIQVKPIGPPPKSISTPTPLAVPLKPQAPDAAKVDVTDPAKVVTQMKGPLGKTDLKRNMKDVKASFEECSGYDEISNLMFSKMRSHFEMSMLFRNEEQGLVPLSWAGDFKIADEQKPSIIPLQQASIFKIVNASEKPYHGYVVANPINSKFFNEWNSGEIPKHVTIFPVFVEKDLVAMWLGASNKSIDLKTSLADMDSLADSCVPAFYKTLKAA